MLLPSEPPTGAPGCIESGLVPMFITQKFWSVWICFSLFVFAAIQIRTPSRWTLIIWTNTPLFILQTLCGLTGKLHSEEQLINSFLERNLWCDDRKREVAAVLGVGAETWSSHLLVVLGRRAEDGQLGSAGFGFGRLAGVEERLNERLQVLSFLRNQHRWLPQCFYHQGIQKQYFTLHSILRFKSNVV